MPADGGGRRGAHTESDAWLPGQVLVLSVFPLSMTLSLLWLQKSRNKMEMSNIKGHAMKPKVYLCLSCTIQNL